MKKSSLEKLYEKDEFNWLERNAELLRKGQLNEIDSTNLTVFLIEMGEFERSGISNKMRILTGHLLKWKYQPKKRSPTWIQTIGNMRDQIKQDTERSKTLTNKAISDFPAAYKRGRKLAKRETNLPLKTFPAEPEFTFKQMLNDNFWCKT